VKLPESIRTGRDLTWIPESQQICPIHNVDLTIKHVWLECTVAKAVWEELKSILNSLGDEGRGTRLLPPKMVDELVVFMAFSPYKGPEDRRWKVLYQTAVWCIWKDFLSHSFASNYRLWEPGAARSNYRETVMRQALADRAACILERYRGKEMNPIEFEMRWGNYRRH
jgi:hypothetical protein